MGVPWSGLGAAAAAASGWGGSWGGSLALEADTDRRLDDDDPFPLDDWADAGLRAAPAARDMRPARFFLSGVVR